MTVDLRLLGMAFAGVLSLSGWVSAGFAQQLDCSNPVAQVEMTGCASLDYDKADAALNAVWKQAMAKAQEMDKSIGAGDVPAATILRDAQRAWIPYRDKACEAESLKARGGTLQQQLFYECLTRMTGIRTDDLASFATEY
ncbi:hypothetical protein P775_00245 [Puniceibacterium antarcticum]|uniref:Lysozyme inhibitor LprI-like N-terminal domain-containing protein n=1 Tax=Puniceibacterium antarcticum TaxID=1206336 RepID=A0A2G8RL31_9RHOB|nr:lysozyme inhibitor LprI family protein [Puniceibacterium antarcticum]PIL22259.1 hypothetical protein P775_00245 [Puniceibacterium antarcticum]